MLRITTAGASALALMAGIHSATAADIVTYEPQPTPSVYSPTQAAKWNGPYLGLTGGYGWGGSTIGHNGWLGGAYGGYNFQVNQNWMFGVEGDITATGKSGSNGSTTASNPWNSTFRGRLGRTFGRSLVYGTAGVAIGGVRAVTGSTTETATKTGWTAGLGVETVVTETVTGRLELRHTRYGPHTFSSSTPATISYGSTDLMFGFGKRF